MIVINRTRNTLHWSLGFSKTVSPDVEIFKIARAELTGHVEHLLSLEKGSAIDAIKIGIALRHSASKSGNMDLVGLHIQN